MQQRFLTFFLMLLCSLPAMAQIGGQRSFEFLNVPGDARTAALGGISVAQPTDDVNAFFNNPALLDSAADNQASLSYLAYLGGVKFSNIAYAKTFERYGTWALGLKYLNYGKITAYDESGFELGDFKANELAVVIGHSRNSGNFSIGGNLKLVLSTIASNKANALLLDIGGAFKHPTKDLTIGLAIKNIGFLMSDYSETANTILPFDVQVGVSIKPQHMPIRFSVAAYNLYKGDIAFFDPNSNLGHDNLVDEPKVVDKIFRHFVFSATFEPSKNFNFRIGYNHLMRRELRLEEISGGSGFSTGFMFSIKSFEIAYSKTLFHVAGSTNHLTLISNFNTLIKKK